MVASMSRLDFDEMVKLAEEENKALLAEKLKNTTKP
jgi:hypothetical protein